MYSSTHLTSDQREYFENLEVELERPVRILYGNGRTVDPSQFTTWNDEQLAAVGNPTQEDVQARGLTILYYATTGTRSGYYDARMTPVEGYGVDYVMAYDTLLVDPDTVMAHTVNYTDLGRRYRDANGELTDQRVFAEVLDRLIIVRSAFLGNYDGVDLDLVFRPAVDLALSGDFDGLMEQIFLRNAERFQEYVAGRVGDPVANVREQLDNQLNNVNIWEQRIAAARPQLRQLQAQLDAMMRAMDEGLDTRATLTEQFRRLINDDRIDTITFSGSTVTVVTNHLNLMHPLTRQDVYLGKLRWTMDLGGYTVRVENITNPRGGRAHPHIGTAGDPCFGQMGNSIYEYLNAGDMEAAIEMMFSFLASVNLDDDWGRLARWWFDENPMPPRLYNGTIIEQEVTA